MFQLSSLLYPRLAKLNSTKISENDKLFDLEIYIVELRHTDINFIIAIYRNTTPLFKMEIRLAYTERNVWKDTKNHEQEN